MEGRGGERRGEEGGVEGQGSGGEVREGKWESKTSEGGKNGERGYIHVHTYVCTWEMAKVAYVEHHIVLVLKCPPFALKQTSQDSDRSHSDFELKFLNEYTQYRKSVE